MGAHCTTWLEQDGVNFAVYSRHAECIEVCLYDTKGEVEIARLALPECLNGVWHGFVSGLGAGQLYGLRWLAAWYFGPTYYCWTSRWERSTRTSASSMSGARRG